MVYMDPVTNMLWVIWMVWVISTWKTLLIKGSQARFMLASIEHVARYIALAYPFWGIYMTLSHPDYRSSVMGVGVQMGSYFLLLGIWVLEWWLRKRRGDDDDDIWKMMGRKIRKFLRSQSWASSLLGARS